MLVATTNEIAGYRIVRHVGMVRGVIVRSRSVIGSIGASLQSLLGGNISLYTTLAERTRQDAFQLMVAHAQEVGANAVVGMRYDGADMAPGITEVMAYGTAVVVEPV
jgi:uncharacterized protein YbjQ (UPF0145 family)